MAENKSKKLPQFNTNQELVEFFDTHDLGEYEGELPEAHFDVDIKRSHYLVSINRDLMSKLLEVAKEQQISVEMLVDSWLKEKLIKAS
ncbi:CopG family antitoxin [Chlorogloeopsis sp. ULAP02]|uniref:CopG family antitoxin n=1 Tax=Chlorogloeopsis sp. ULAP02 TaxID=3107926 RepID=UPI0031367C65